MKNNYKQHGQNRLWRIGRSLFQIGNTAQSQGGGVFVFGGTFAMTGGAVNNNTAQMGGGVYVESGDFTKSGGTIYGQNGGANANAASANGQGHAAYAATGSMYRDSTADGNVNLTTADTVTNWNQ